MSEKLVDINGNEFKVGCVFDFQDGKEREVLKVLSNRIIYLGKGEIVWIEAQEFLKKHFARILHYRELAPDKNGKMLCEGDTVSKWDAKVIALSSVGKYIICAYPDGEFSWANPFEVTFVSRPTDAPSEAAKKKAELLAKADELIAKANEMKEKAKEM
jgi:hypothetical protein